MLARRLGCLFLRRNINRFLEMQFGLGRLTALFVSHPQAQLSHLMLWLRVEELRERRNGFGQTIAFAINLAERIKHDLMSGRALFDYLQVAERFLRAAQIVQHGGQIYPRFEVGWLDRERLLIALFSLREPALLLIDPGEIKIRFGKFGVNLYRPA